MKITLVKVLRFAATMLLEKCHKIKFISPTASCKLENIAAILLGKKVRFNYNKKSKVFVAKECQRERFFTNSERGFWLYRNGIADRGNFLFRSYCLQNIALKDDDVVLDCGANSGDLTLELMNISPSIKYIGIEPAPSDFDTLRRNVNSENATLINKALGDKDGEINFYICSEKGDSSIIEPPSYTEIINVEVTQLNTLVKDLCLKKIKLIKIEAEGYEPEILYGAREVLDRIEYIAVDGGYERGVDNEQTLTTVTNFLLSNNFEMVDIYFPWYRALYRNKNLT